MPTPYWKNPRAANRVSLLVLIFALTMTSPATAGPDPASVPTRQVILVHGIYDTAWTLRKLERRLTEAGFTVHVTPFKPNNGSVPLEESARQIAARIEAAVPPGTPISLVGFSMGGLIARYYVQRLADPSQVETLVTIASPHHGTWLAWFGLHQAVRQMRPGSEFLEELDSDVGKFSSIRWVTIRTPLDLMILPSVSTKLDWAENHSYPVLMHPLIPFDDRVIDQTIRSLKNEPGTQSITN